MKCLSWNSRGMANSLTRLVLKRLVLKHNPGFIFISEPMISFDNFPRRWLSNLHMKLLAMNSRDNFIPNIWCICKVNLNPTILSCEDKHVTFSFSENSKTYPFLLSTSPLTTLKGDNYGTPSLIYKINTIFPSISWRF